MSKCPRCSKDNGPLYSEGEHCTQCSTILSLEAENKRLIKEVSDLENQNKELKFFNTFKRGEDMTFVLECTMKARWVPHFLSMIKYMQQLGNLGASRCVTLHSDGDGDFRPKFKFDSALPCDVKPVRDQDGNRTYDAG